MSVREKEREGLTATCADVISWRGSSGLVHKFVAATEDVETADGDGHEDT